MPTAAAGTFRICGFAMAPCFRPSEASILRSPSRRSPAGRPTAFILSPGGESWARQPAQGVCNLARRGYAMEQKLHRALDLAPAQTLGTGGHLNSAGCVPPEFVPENL